MPVGTYIIATEPMGPRACGRTAAPNYFRLNADHRPLFGAGDSYGASTPRGLVSRIRKRILNVFPPT